jgi:hypothetical protein
MTARIVVRVAAAALVAASGTVVQAQIHGRPAIPAGRRPATDVNERYAKAWREWNAGRYDVSLAELASLLRAPGTDALLPQIAELTGEQYRSVEVAQNARQPMWAPDGKHILFQQLPTPVTPAPGVPAVAAPAGGAPFVLAVLDDTVRRIGEIRGSGFAFAPDSRRLAYLVARAGGEAPIVRVRDLASGQERDVDNGGMAASQLAWSSDGQSLFGIAALGDEAPQVVSWRDASGTPSLVSRTDSAKTNLIVVAGGRHLVYSIAAAGGGRGGRGGAGGGGGRGGGRGGAGAGGSFELFDLTTNTARRIAGRNVVVSRDGSALAFLTGGSAATPASVMRLSLQASGAGEPFAVHRTEFQIQAPAIAPDGSRVAFQQMPREDWEIMVASATDTIAQRVTTEIQHDLSPVFLSPTRLMGLIGEARHRRSYLYDVPSMSRTRLFHNNTVRTIAPEYEWVPSPDGNKVLIGAERDGDTVTPHRHVYCIDLTRPVTRAALVARVDSALTAERSLRAFATRSFAAIDTAVRAATRAVDVGRVYDYARTLHSFGSKHWTQPGNKPAREYLRETYKSFGYDATFQTFTPTGRGGGRGGAGAITETANVVAVLPGTVNPELVYVVGSHFDSVQPGPGADDNSSGTTALLEAARVLATRPQPATIIFVSFTGEEGGLLGSREFVRRARDSLNVVGALNNDMVGFANDERLDNTIRYSNAGIKDIQHAGAIRYSSLITYDAFYYKSTDAAAFFDAYGDIVGGIGSYPVLGNPHYHQSHDVLETINQQLVAEVSRTTVATLMLLASSPSRLTGLAATRAGTAVTLKWNASPEKGIARYIVSYRGADGAAKRVSVTTPTARLIDAPPGTEISVKAVNVRGLEGWDWARVTAR